jgi:hypothetical protein
MTQGQTLIKGLTEIQIGKNCEDSALVKNRKAKIIYANTQEIEEHQNYFKS